MAPVKGFWNYRIWRERGIGFTLRETYYNDRGQLYSASSEPQVGPAKNIPDLLARIANLRDSASIKEMMRRDVQRFERRLLTWPRRRWAKAMHTK